MTDPASLPAPVVEWTPAAEAVVTAVREACVADDGQDPLDEAALLRLKHHGLADSRLWLAGPDGFALLHDGGLDLAVAPSARRSGIGGALAALAAPQTRTAWSHGDHPAARRLAERFDFEATRDLWVMRRPQAPLPDVGETSAPIRGYREDDRDALLAVNAAAFAHHPEQGGMDAADLAMRMAEPWFDPAGLLVAEDPDRPGDLLGFHWTKRTGPSDGEVYVVAVAPRAQGRGLGRALTLAGLHHLADADEVVLYVEADNAPAVAVYRSLGFAHAAADTHVQYHRRQIDA